MATIDTALLDRPVATTPQFDPEAAPDTVRLAAGGRQLRLQWRDGSSASLTAAALRGACRCAWCTAARHRGVFIAPEPDIAVTSLETLGHFAVHIVFSDQHRKGVFPWTYLRALAADSIQMPESVA